MFDTVIANGTVVLPDQQMIKADLGIQDGKMAAISQEANALSGRERIDADGKHIFPGVIEPHSHIGIGAGEQDLLTETAAAALGGVTTVLFFLRQPMPYPMRSAAWNCRNWPSCLA